MMSKRQGRELEASVIFEALKARDIRLRWELSDGTAFNIISRLQR